MRANELFHEAERCNTDTVTHYTAVYCYHVSLLFTPTAKYGSCRTQRYTVMICLTRLHILHLSRI